MYGMHKKINSAPIVFAVIALFISAPLFAESHLQSAAGKAQARIEKVEQLLLEYDRTLPLAEAATGDVELLFQSRLADKERQILHELNGLVDAILAAEPNAPDLAAARALAVEWSLELSPEVIKRAESQNRAVMALAMQEAPASSADALALETELQREIGALMYWFGAVLQTSKNMAALGLDSAKAENYLHANLPPFAELLASAVGVSLDRINDVRFQLSLLPNDEELQRRGTVVELQLNTAAQGLSQAADLLEELDLNTSDYRGLVIQVTGEITSDVFSLGVLRVLLREWGRKSAGWAVDNGPNVVIKALLFMLISFVAWVLSRITGRVTAKAVERLQLSRLLSNMIVTIAANLVLILGLLIALAQLGISLGPLLAGLGVIGFIVGFALQETLGNFAAGMMILAYRPFDEGDMVHVGGVMGTVHHMSLVSTVILTPDNQKLIVPNNKIWGDVIRNVNAQNRRRVDLVFGVSYGDDLPAAEQLLMKIIKNHAMVLDAPEPVVKVHELAESAVNFVVRPWVLSENYWDAYWDITREVKLVLAQEGFTIPFPQRDVHVVQSGNLEEKQ